MLALEATLEVNAPTLRHTYDMSQQMMEADHG
jgi:hypothetical protein